MAEELEGSTGNQSEFRSRYAFTVTLSGPVTIKVTGPAVALVLGLALLVLVWYLSR
ncbi:hypothetical protein [Amycolatopsis sp. NPDC004625]|uniref:hypothetical protein n=1 Tax=Amycolatopsis sp. NPDC004625 TaxID=3154670 RepID=UPI0033A147FB